MTGPAHPRESALRIALVYPELLGTYGDGGNASILAARASWRGLAVQVVPVVAGSPVPDSCDVYLLGGGEDEPQALAAAGVRAHGALARAVNAGAAVLAVCAGLQIVGTYFPGTDGRRHDGAALADFHTDPGSPRAVGDLVIAGTDAGVGLLYGYENHGGRTTLGAGVQPLGSVLLGLGNGAGQRDRDGREVDGLWAPIGAGLMIGTYLHGPALAQNPELADRLLAHVYPDLPPLPADDPRVVTADLAVRALRAARQQQTIPA